MDGDHSSSALSDLGTDDTAAPMVKLQRYCVIARTDAIGWEERLDGLEDGDWSNFDLVKAPAEDYAEIYLYAPDPDAARVDVIAKGDALGLPALEEIDVQPAGPEPGISGLA